MTVQELNPHFEVIPLPASLNSQNRVTLKPPSQHHKSQLTGLPGNEYICSFIFDYNNESKKNKVDEQTAAAVSVLLSKYC